MDIRYAIKDYFDIDGDGVFRLLPEHLDRLDLLIRESIQNSLDAALPGANTVRVDLFEDTFSSKDLADLLPQLDLRSFQNLTECRYLAIRDSGTEGLTGVPYTKSRDIGRFQKLVFSITKAQDQKGAGGSHGIGKTIFFKLGIGLVLFYSRIKNQDGSYESRLIANYIEDPKSNQKLRLQVSKDQRHIAWWGTLNNANEILPITDKDEIEIFLSYFNNFELYKGEETGTSIIIPYFSGDKLINAKQNPIYRDAESYIVHAIQKWYAPRLNNTKIKQFLKCTYNGVPIKLSEPFFKKLQDLYNLASGAEPIIPGDVYCEKIKLQRAKLIGDSIGTLAYCKTDGKSLGMLPPYNCPSPAEIIANEKKRDTLNEPIVVYCRKPGMIISYTDKEWVSKVEATAQNEFIIGFFVLNSKAQFKPEATNGKISDVEEYLRMCELSDHHGWQDATNPEIKTNIVMRMKNAVASQIRETFCSQSFLRVDSVNKAIGRKIAAAVLPPESINSKYIAVGGTGGGHGVGGIGARKQTPLPSSRKFHSSEQKGSCEIIDVDYKNNNLVQTKLVATIPANMMLTLTLAVDADGEKLTNEEWDSQFGENSFPLSFFQIYITAMTSCETGSTIFKGEEIIALGKTMNLSNIAEIQLSEYELSIKTKETIQVDITSLFKNSQFVYSTLITKTATGF